MATDLAVLGRDPLFGGGGQRQTEAFLRAARELGHEADFAFDPHPGLRGPRVTWRRVEALRQLAWERQAAPAAPRLWVVSTHATDGGPALHAPSYKAWIGTTVDGEFAGRAPGLSRGRRAAFAASLAPLRALERKVLRGADALYATSAASRAEVAAAAGREDVGILPIPVDLELFTPAGGRPPRQTALFVGRADDPRKNVALLLAAARLRPDVEFELAGTPPREALPPNVTALGPVGDLPAVLRRASVFVLPSRQEGFGIAAAEALAAGVPVVTTPSGGPEELVRDSGGGRVLDGFTPQELAHELASLLADDETRAQMAAAGRAYVERHHSPERLRAALAAAL